MCPTRTVLDMELILVRHAQPAWVDDGRAVNDPGLTELGHRQAAAAAERLSRDEHAFDEVLVSTAQRAQETCDPIAAAVDPAPDTHDWLHEIRRPDHWDGSPIENLRELWIANRRAGREQRWGSLDGGEATRDFYDRVTGGLDAALAERGVRRHPDDPDHLWEVADAQPNDDGFAFAPTRRIIVVAHAGTNSVILSHLLGVDPQPWEWDRFWSQHASVSRLHTTPVANGHIFSLRAFSDTSHLAPADVTS